MKPQPPPTAGPPSLLRARGLAFDRNDQPIFGPLDFHVDAGEALLVHGSNGSGKTTLLRVLAGLLQPSRGQILVRDAPASAERIAQTCTLLGHLLGHKGELTACENLEFAQGLFGRRADIDIEQALFDVGLAGFEDAPARQFSAGQRKRLALARLLLVPAPLWLLDEPYANLDLPGIDRRGSRSMLDTSSITAACRALLLRDFRLLWRRRGDALNPVLFALLVISLFPFALGLHPDILGRIAPGVIWVALLLAGLRALETL